MKKGWILGLAAAVFLTAGAAKADVDEAKAADFVKNVTTEFFSRSSASSKTLSLEATAPRIV